MESNIVSLKDKHTSDIDNLKKDYNYNINKLKSLHNEEIEKLNSTILNYQEDLENYNLKLEKANSLNSNLLRISRERANQERNLRPKKSHNGFVILNRQSIPYKFYFNSNSKNRKTNFIEFECFKTKIQTPFNSSINLDLIKDDIINSFKNIMNEFSIDIWYNYYSINNTSLSNLEEIFYSSKNNFIFKHCFITNYKSNLWQLEIYTKKDIVLIEEIL